MNNKIVLFTDIDDTLIQTKRKTDFKVSSQVAGFNKDNIAHSYIYDGVKEFIDKIIDSGMLLIPTTARNYESYSRTIFQKDSRINNFILNFGAELYIENSLDREWQDIMDKNYKNISLDVILKDIIILLGKFELVVKIIDNYYISIYNKKNIGNIEINREISNILNSYLSSKEFYLYKNDSSFAILPNFLNKSFAVAHILNRYKPILTIGAGDNMNDLHFMDMCDYQLMPTVHTKFKKEL